MKKRIVTLAVVLMVIVILTTACGAKQEAEWSIEVAGAKADAFTSVDYGTLDEVEIDVVMKKKTGTEVNQKWQGVLLSDIVEYLGVTDYSSITVEAADGYAKDYTPDVVDDSMTILGTVLDGEPLGADNNWVQTVAGNQPGSMWIRDVVKITVNK